MHMGVRRACRWAHAIETTATHDLLNGSRQAAISEHVNNKVAFMGADEGEGMTYAGSALEHLLDELNGAKGTHG